jgi:hypothetical protein
MRLGVRFLRDVANVNTFRPTDRHEMFEGDTTYVYFQLVDQSVDRPSEGFSPPFRRYCPASGATLQVTLESIDMAKGLTRSASQPFAQDPSVWRLQVLATDVVRGTVSLLVKLTEGSEVHSARVPAGIAVSQKECVR